MSRVVYLPPPPPLLLTKRVTAFLRANLSPHIHSAMLTTPAGGLLAHASSLPASALRRQAAVAASLWSIQGPAQAAAAAAAPAAPAAAAPAAQDGEAAAELPAGSTVRARKSGKKPPTVTVQLESGAVFVIRRLRCGMLFICMGGAESAVATAAGRNTPTPPAPDATPTPELEPQPESEPTIHTDAPDDAISPTTEETTPIATTTATNPIDHHPLAILSATAGTPPSRPSSLPVSPGTVTPSLQKQEQQLEQQEEQQEEQQLEQQQEQKQEEQHEEEQEEEQPPPQPAIITTPAAPTASTLAPAASSPSEVSILTTHTNHTAQTAGAAPSVASSSATGSSSSAALMRRQVEELGKWLDERLGGLCVPEEGIGMGLGGNGSGIGVVG